MGSDPKAFYSIAFLGSMLFATGAYAALLAIFPAFTAARLMSKKDALFMTIFLKYLDEGEAYSSVPRPEDWEQRPVGWGKGLPW